MAEPARRVLFSAQKNEGPFILEWVAYHKVVGFTDIVVVSNDCTDGSDDLLDVLQAAGALTHIRQVVPDGVSPQLAGAEIFLTSDHARPGDWVMWLDLDEYLVVRSETRRVGDLIARFPDADAIGLCWRVFGSAGQANWTGEQVAEPFIRASRRKWPPNTQIKTLFRLTDKIKLMHLHRPVFHDGPPERIRFVGGDGAAMDAGFAFKMMPRAYPVHKIHRDRDLHHLGQVNHYAVRTPDLYGLKKLRGRGLASAQETSERHTDEFFAQYDQNHQEDRAILADLAAKRAEMDRLWALPGVKSACLSIPNFIAHHP